MIRRGRNRVIVLGFPRSGTGTMAKIHNIGHEKETTRGTSDWRLAYDYKKQDGDYLIHVIRNPLDCIASNLFTSWLQSLNFLIKKTGAMHTEKSTLELWFRLWIMWNRRIQSLNPDETVQIESISEITNRRKHPKIALKDLKLPPELIKEVQDYAKELGYEL